MFTVCEIDKIDYCTKRTVLLKYLKLWLDTI